MKTPAQRLTSRRGSVLIVALLLSAVIAVALANFIRIAVMSQKMAQRTFLSAQAMNNVEAGLEEALWSFNQANLFNTAAWNGWSQGQTGSDRLRKFTGFTGSPGVTANVNVYVKNFDSDGSPVPVGIAKATVQPIDGPPIVKMVEVYYARRSFFSTGMVGKRGITFLGSNTLVDSWKSGITTGNFTPYSTAVRRPNASIAASGIDADISVQNAKIYGFVSVGSSDVSSVSIGPGGLVAGDFAATTTDTSRIASNFTSDLPEITVPAPTTVNNITAAGGVLDGNIYPKASGRGQILDAVNAADGTYYYKATSIDLDSSRGKDPAMTIRAGYKVVFILQNGTGGAGTETVSTGTNSTLTIEAGSSLSIYTAGDVRLTGTGVSNASGNSASLQIWGTNPALNLQRIQVLGQGGLNGIIYAPNASIEVNGGGDISGAIVGDRITLSGQGNFHYDESLADYGIRNPFRVVKWRELVSATERDTFSSLMDF